MSIFCYFCKLVFDLPLHCQNLRVQRYEQSSDWQNKKQKKIQEVFLRLRSGLLLKHGTAGKSMIFQ